MISRTVPVEPTEEMVDAGAKAGVFAYHDTRHWIAIAKLVYKAMLAAAPAEQPGHPHTDQCGYDRNGSVSAGHYVCMCGYEDEARVRVVLRIAGKTAQEWNTFSGDYKDIHSIKAAIANGIREALADPILRGGKS